MLLAALSPVLALGACVALWSTALGQTGVTTRVSVDSNGNQADLSSSRPSISHDGHLVAFQSWATNLVPGGTAGLNVFLHDRNTPQTTCLTSQGNLNSAAPSLSGDGLFVAFQSAASNLVPGDTNGVADVFVCEIATGTIVRVSLGSGGTQANNLSEDPAISTDGRFVAFWSIATNLDPAATNGYSQVFLHDRQTGQTLLASVDSNGAQGNGPSNYRPALSDDGRFVAFGSGSTNLVVPDTFYLDVFVHDFATGLTTRASRSTGGIAGDGDSMYPSMSGDGQLVAFNSWATNLVLGDTNNGYDVFLHDRTTGVTSRESVSSNGAQASTTTSACPVGLSTDGRYVGFYSGSNNLVLQDTNNKGDVFLHDHATGQTIRCNVDSAGVEANGWNEPWAPAVSADGHSVSFANGSSNLVPGDTNQWDDVFVHDLPFTAFTNLCEPGSGGTIGCPCSNPPSGAGRGCDNSAATGGAALTAAGYAYLAADTLVFTTTGEKATATSIVLQGNAQTSAGLVFGQGVRCASGGLKRLYVKTASGGSIIAPGAGDPSTSARSAALGDPISAGQSRWYLVYYRDPIVLGGCPVTSTFNATQTGRVDWTQ